MLDRKNNLFAILSLSYLLSGCVSRNVMVPAPGILPMYIAGTIIDAIVDENKHPYDPDYRIGIQIDDSKCNVTELELEHIRDSIHIVAQRMERSKVESLLGLDKMRDRIVVTGTGADLANFINTYYLGNKICIEMEFNEFTGTLNEMPKLIGSNWVSLK